MDEENVPSNVSEGAVRMEVFLPVCRCGSEVKKIRYLDYDDIRVVYHEEAGCVLGVIPISDY